MSGNREQFRNNQDILQSGDRMHFKILELRDATWLLRKKRKKLRNLASEVLAHHGPLKGLWWGAGGKAPEAHGF